MDFLQVLVIIKIASSIVADFIQWLATFLDRPLFPWKKVIVGFSLAQYLFEGFLSLRQYQVLKQTRPPKALAGEVSQEVFDKSQVIHSFGILRRRHLTLLGIWTSESEVWRG
jgi:hypothetical protein